MTLTQQIAENAGTWTVETWGDNGLLAQTTWPTEQAAEQYAQRVYTMLGARIIARVVPNTTKV